MSLLVDDLIYAGFREAGILTEAGRGVSYDEGNDGLLLLNSIVDSALTDRLMVYGQLGQVIPLQANKPTYTIGLTGGADVVAQRPERIDNAEYTFTNVTPPIQEEFEILTDQDWEALSPKTFQAPIPYKLYYRTDFPLGTIFVWPIPTDVSQVSQITIYLWQQILTFASRTTQVFLPPGYQAWLEFELAVRLVTRYPKRALTPLAVLNQQRAAYKSAVKNANNEPLVMQSELASLSATPKAGWNPYTGRYNNP
jgi:hypothetical protein